ncbi:MAG: hypothetical protein FWG70_05280 [Oscillospiraceae bacterium]|nr:hypothetical protein [Oscillospiraceae bacterium]
MESRAEKIKAAISSLEARIKAAYEYLEEEEQRAKDEGFEVTSISDYNRIKGQIPVAHDKLKDLKAELDKLQGVEEDAPAPLKAEEEHTAEAEESSPSITTTPVENSTAGHTAILGISAESLTKRGFAFLHDEEWSKAHEKFDNALDINPEYARAYVGLLCVELKVVSEADLANLDAPLTGNANFKKALRYAGEEYGTMLQSFNQIISGRKKQNELKERMKQEQERREREDEEIRLAEEERRLEEKKRKAEEEIRQKEDEKRKREEEEEKLKKEEERERRLEAKKLKDEEEKRQIEEEQEYRKNQKEWRKKGLCYYCGGKKNVIKKCKDCGKTS